MFLHPWALVLGALAVGLPVLIHRLTRPKPMRIPISTIRFIQEAIQQCRARHRLRDFIILSLRTLAVILLALALARPLTGQRNLVTGSDESAVVRVVLVDISQSMATRVRGIELFERGRPLAARKLVFQSGLKADLILAGARPRAVFGIPSTNFSALQEELSQSSPRPERLNVQPALNMAAELLSQGGNAEGVRRELFIVSDFQRTNWADADFSVLPSETEIQLQSISSGDDSANLALLRVSAQGRAEVGRELRLEVEVGNYSSTPRLVRAEISLGDAVYQLEGNCAPNSKTILTIDILPRKVGWLTGEARLIGIEDALPADNTRPCVLEVLPPPTYVLITRQPETLRPSSSYFIERGLMPMGPGEGRRQSRLIRIDSVDIDSEILGSADVIVLDHPGRLSNETINQLAALLRRGRGVLYVASEQIDATNLRLLSDAAGAGLQMPVEFLPLAASESRRNLLLTEPRQDRPPFSIFGDSTGLCCTYPPLTASNARRIMFSG
ncbi:MAG: BatA and WFA domain-containing protein [Planctomycetes bacterium]|nr:BatA and WFA domain-containing protein [Planctomycetota bacterium]